VTSLARTLLKDEAGGRMNAGASDMLALEVTREKGVGDCLDAARTGLGTGGISGGDFVLLSAEGRV